MIAGRSKTLIHHRNGQSMVEFALILPLIVLFIIGVFELGRAFFAYIAITNAAREGTRVYTFWPNKATVENIDTAVNTEIGTAPLVDVSNIESIQIACGTLYNVIPVDLDTRCPTEQPIRVTVTYNFDLILKIFFSSPLKLVRSAEMMVP
jgi:Flp pilus assembly pilin Flp